MERQIYINSNNCWSLQIFVELNNWIVDISNSIIDLNNSIVDLNNWIVDINNSIVDLNNSIVELSKSKHLLSSSNQLLSSRIQLLISTIQLLSSTIRSPRIHVWNNDTPDSIVSAISAMFPHNQGPVVNLNGVLLNCWDQQFICWSQ